MNNKIQMTHWLIKALTAAHGRIGKVVLQVKP